MNSRIKAMLSLLKQSLLDPENAGKKQISMNLIEQGYDFSQTIPLHRKPTVAENPPECNPLQDFFESQNHKTIWKWLHYFDVYHHHLSVFQGKNPTLLEVGVYGGGSLEMWQSYFHQGCCIIGVDIDESCQRHAGENISIHIGDQSDRNFWRKFAALTAQIDIVIDDGGHRPGQQIVTLEECLPLLGPGGVYICEDVHGFDNLFLDYIHGLSKSINAYNEEAEFVVVTNRVQQHIHSIHLYPYMVVIQINSEAVTKYVAQKRGTDS